jgi:hypothetical protein
MATMDVLFMGRPLLVNIQVYIDGTCNAGYPHAGTRRPFYRMELTTSFRLYYF